MFPLRAPLVGLDIGSATVKAVALRRGRSTWSLVTAGSASLDDAGDDQVADAIVQLLASLQLSGAAIISALAGHALVVKRLTMVLGGGGEVGAAVRAEAAQHLPFDLAEVQLDYQILGPSEASGAREVLLVAARRDRIDERVALITEAGCRAVVLDIEAFALANAYRVSYPDRADPLSLLVHVGRSLTLVCLLSHGEPVFTRDLPIGGRLHVDALLREFEGLSRPSAFRLLHSDAPLVISPEIETVLRRATSELVLEVRRTVDFFRVGGPPGALDRVVVSGGGCGAIGLLDMLAAEFSAVVELFDPFRALNQSGSDTPRVHGPSFAVAVGLALRGEDSQ